jgi:hypothetical protein
MTLGILPVTPPVEPANWATLLALYVGPDQILPLTSLLGAIVGILLIFWRYVVALAGRVWRFLCRR